MDPTKQPGFDKLSEPDKRRAQALIDSAASFQEDINMLLPDESEDKKFALMNLDTVLSQCIKALIRGSQNG